jgi:hypothetical protein
VHDDATLVVPVLFSVVIRICRAAFSNDLPGAGRLAIAAGAPLIAYPNAMLNLRSKQYVRQGRP